jgi:hypothetical protein
VSARKSVSGARKRKPYRQPAVKKLTLEEAKKVLEAKSIPGDEQAEQLLKQINRRLETK